MAGTDASEGQALWQPGGAEDSRLREDNRHLHLAYDEEEEGVVSLLDGLWYRCPCRVQGIRGSNPSRVTRMTLTFAISWQPCPIPWRYGVGTRTGWPAVSTL